MLYSEQNTALAIRVVELLNENALKISTAESCTGGLLSSYITAVSGASSVFDMGIVSYSARAKQQLLRVNPTTIATFGTISEKTAEEMAQGIRNLSNADIGVSVTGVAGPSTAEGKDVGTIYATISHVGETRAIKLEIVERERENIRQEVCFRILTLIINHFERGIF